MRSLNRECFVIKTEICGLNELAGKSKIDQVLDVVKSVL